MQQDSIAMNKQRQTSVRSRYAERENVAGSAAEPRSCMGEDAKRVETSILFLRFLLALKAYRLSPVETRFCVMKWSNEARSNRTTFKVNEIKSIGSIGL